MDNEQKNDILSTIEHTYPPDKHEDGRELLIQALCHSWKDLPDKVLIQLYHLCINKEQS